MSFTDDSGSFRQVLLVESDECERTQIERYLVGRGFVVSAVSSVSHADEVSETTAFNLVVANLTLRDGTSHELMRKLKERRIVDVSISRYGDSFERSRVTSVGLAPILEPLWISNLSFSNFVCAHETTEHRKLETDV